MGFQKNYLLSIVGNKGNLLEEGKGGEEEKGGQGGIRG
jgi:hypothetical protein